MVPCTMGPNCTGTMQFSIAFNCNIQPRTWAPVPASVLQTHCDLGSDTWLNFLIILGVSPLKSWGLKSSCKVVWGFLWSWFGQMPVAKLTLTIATKESVMLLRLEYSCCTSELWLYNQRHKRKGVISSRIYPLQGRNYFDTESSWKHTSINSWF